MADTAKRLAGPTALTGSAATVYTVPGSTKAVLRNIHVANENAAARDLTISIGTDGAGKRIFYNMEIAGESSFDWTGFIVLDAAEVLQAHASATSSLTLVVSGVEVA